MAMWALILALYLYKTVNVKYTGILFVVIILLCIRVIGWEYQKIFAGFFQWIKKVSV